MSSKHQKKLQLGRETIRNLQAPEMKNIDGRAVTLSIVILSAGVVVSLISFAAQCDGITDGNCGKGESVSGHHPSCYCSVNNVASCHC